MGSSASEEIIMANQLASLLEAEHAAAITTTDFFPFPQNNNTCFPVIQQSQLIKPFFSTDIPPNHYYFSQHQNQNQNQQSLLFSLKPSSDHLLHFPSSFPSTTAAATHLLSSLHRSSSSNLWDVGEGFVRGRNGDGDGGGGDDDDEDRKPPRLRVSTTTMKRIKGRKKVREPRFCFKTMSDVDVLDDGYKWRKYGQKVVKNTLHPRSYYRCTQDNCRVKKRVERLAEDPRMVITTYEGRHAHSPSPDNLEETMGQLPSSHLNNFFW